MGRGVANVADWRWADPSCDLAIEARSRAKAAPRLRTARTLISPRTDGQAEEIDRYLACDDIETAGLMLCVTSSKVKMDGRQR